MSSKSALGPGELDSFISSLKEFVAKAKSLAQIAQWLEAQRFVASVRVMDYLRKSEPPQREILVELRMEDASIESRSVTIDELAPDEFRLRHIRAL